MPDTFNMLDLNKKIVFIFCFRPSNKRVHLTQQQLDHFPYLVALIAHKNDFLSIQNKNGEYVLSPPIHYNWFMAILHSITLGQPYVLFNELPEHDNVLEMFQLIDYLGVKLFSFPYLKGEPLVYSNPSDNDKNESRVTYHRATLAEVRNTAAEFIIALSKNVYDLSDCKTVQCIFSLIMDIFLNENIFSSRFRQHTLTIVKEHCISLFSKRQIRRLPTTDKINQSSTDDFWIYLDNDNDSLPDHFTSTFSWRGVYISPEEDDISLSLVPSVTIFDRPMWFISDFYARPRPWMNLLHYLLEDILRIPPVYEFDKKQQVGEEAKSARSGHFNTLPKRPKVDKFKHRSGPKAQKYR